MRLCHLFTLTANSGDGKQARVPHKRIGAKAGVQCDQPQRIVFSPRYFSSTDRASGPEPEEFDRRPNSLEI
jgi:hypothetical protein